MNKIKLIAANILLISLILAASVSTYAGALPANFFIPYTGEQIAAKGLGKHSSISKFGENPDIDTADGFEPVWDGAAAYTVPTVPRLHNVKSTSIADAGSVVSSGTATGGSETTLVDSTATFITDGVAAGDYVVNDTDFSIGRILTIPSETTVTVGRQIDPGTGTTIYENESGSTYRIVTATSTGASFVVIYGLDTYRAALNEFVVLNGTSNVATTGTYSRQFRMRMYGAGSAKSAVGTITSTAQTDGTVTCQLINGNNQSLMSIYTVPAGKTAYLHRWWGSISKNAGANVSSTVQIRVGELDDAGYIKQTRSINRDGTSAFDHEFTTPMVIPGGVDVWMEANASANDTSISGGFGIILVDN